jgi:uncharacterized protein (DUF302 family)
VESLIRPAIIQLTKRRKSCKRSCAPKESLALVDHSGEAAKVGMKMRPTKLLIFGNPRAGTPLMQASPSIAIDLPLKILIWEDAAGKVWVSYNSPSCLRERHHLPEELERNIAVVETLAADAAK